MLKVVFVVLVLVSPPVCRAEHGSSEIETLCFEGGNFMQGAKENTEQASQNEKPRHRVMLDPFEISSREIAATIFEQFVRESSYVTFQERQSPEFNWRTVKTEGLEDASVVAIAWEDAVAFCQWLSHKLDVECRLPSESEWEFALVHASNTTAFKQWDLGSESGMRTVALKLTEQDRNAKIVEFVSSMRTFPSEWCKNRWGKYGVADFKANPLHRVIRGNTVSGDSRSPRPTIRSYAHKRYYVHENIGFRVVFPGTDQRGRV